MMIPELEEINRLVAQMDILHQQLHVSTALFACKCMGVCELVHLGPLREEPWHHLPQRHADTLRSAWQLSAASLAADDSFLDGVDRSQHRIHVLARRLQ